MHDDMHDNRSSVTTAVEDEAVLVALVETHEDQQDLDVQTLAGQLASRGWSADRVVATVRRAQGTGRLFQDCRLVLHASP